MRILKFILLIVILVVSGTFGYGQTGNLDIKGQLEDQDAGTGLGGVTVSLYKDGNLIETVTTQSNGKYKFKKATIGGVFTVKFSKAGFVGKYAEIDTRGIAPEDQRDLPLEVNTSLFSEIPGVDFSILETQPVAKAKYSKDIDNIEWDMTYIEKKKKDVQKIIDKAEADKTANETKYNAAVTAGNNAVAAGKYDEAITKYNEALGIKPEDVTVKQKIKEAEEKKTIAAAAAELDQKYNDLMTEAKKFFDAKDYASAKTKYQAAHDTKPTETVAKEKVKEIDKLLAGLLEEETKYSKFISDGEKAMLAENYDEAIKQYTEATKLRPTEQMPKDEIQKAKDAKAAKDKLAQEELKKKAEFDKFVVAGDKGVTDKKYDDAIANFDKALALIDDAAVKVKRDAAVKLRDADVAAKEEQKKIEEEKKRKQDEFNALMTKGNGEMTATEYESAIATFTSALNVIPEEPSAKAKLAEAKKKRDEQVAAEELAKKNKEQKEAFDKLVERGDSETGKAEYDKAIATYKEALVIIKDEPSAVAKLKDAETKKANLARNKADFENFVKAGDKGVTDKKYDDAIASYDKALALFDDASVQSKKDDAIKKRDADIAAKEEQAKIELEKKKKQEEFDALMKKGSGEMTSKDYESAVATFTSALTVIENEPTAKAKLTEAQKLLDEKKKADELAEANKQKQEKFNELVQAGDDEVSAENYDAGIKKYEEALVLIANDPGATKKLNDARTKKAEKDKANVLAEENRKKEEEAQRKKEKFDLLVQQGDADFDAESYDKAINAYNAALLVIDDAGVKKKIEDAKTKLKEKELALKNKEQQDAEFKKLYNEGMTFSNDGEFDNAISKFEAALNIRKDDPDATKALETARQRKQEIVDQLEKDYQNRLVIADKEFDAGNYAEAKKHYVKLTTLKGDDPYPKGRVTECDQKIKEKELADAAATEKRNKYEAAKTKADELFKASKWDESIAKYQEALTHLDESYAKDQIELAKAKKNESITAAEQQKKRELYNAAITKADAAFKASKWDDAIAAYEEALVHLDDNHPKNQIKLAEENKQKEIDLAQKEKLKRDEFNEFMRIGDGEMTSQSYDAAIAAYKDALNVIKDEPSAVAKLKDAEAKKAEKDKLSAKEQQEKLNKEKYEQFMKKGNEDLWAEKFDDAIASYNNALTIYKDDPVAKEKIIEAQTKKKEAELFAKANEEKLRKLEEDFKKHYNQGMTFSNNGDFDHAITEFEAALVIKKGDPDATAALETARKRKLENIEQLEKEYQNRLTIADKEFDAGNYAEAKKHYKKLNEFKPDDIHPKNRIIECDEKLAGLAEREKLKKSFDATMSLGDTELSNKNFDKAISYYLSAKIILPDEKSPDIKIEEARKQKAEYDKLNAEQEKRNRFTRIMNEGQNFMNEANFDPAISKFEEALEVIPNEPTALAAIELAKERKKEAEREIEKILEFADKEFAAKNWKDAKKYYEKYLKFRKEDAYAKSQIKKCQAEIDLIDAAAGEANKYDALIKSGNKLFEEKKYRDARDKFVDALGLLPNMSYPKKKIDEIDELLKLVDQAQENKQNKQNTTKVKKELNYGDRTSMSADDALALLLQSKLDDELDKYEKIKKAKDQVASDNKDADVSSEKERTDNFTTLKTQKDQLSDISSNTSLLDSNSSEYKRMQDKLVEDTKNWNSENNIKQEHKDDINKMYELYDMNKFQERLRYINSEKINDKKDEIADNNKSIDGLAAETRERNGDELVKMKDITNDQFSANGTKQIDDNGKKIRNEFDALNNKNDFIDQQSSITRDKNADDLEETAETFNAQNKVSQEKLLKTNSDKTKEDFVNQHDMHERINDLADVKRNDNSKDLNSRKDDFADQNRLISDELMQRNGDDIKQRHDNLNEKNREIDYLASTTRNINGDDLNQRKDEFTEAQKFTQEELLEKSSDKFIAMHETVSDKNVAMDARAADVRDANGDKLVAQKDLLAGNTNLASDTMLNRNSTDVKNEHDDLNQRNKDMNAHASDVRDDNGDALNKQRDEIKTMNDKGAASPAENIKKLKETQDAIADNNKKTDAAAAKKHQATKDDFTQKTDNALVYEKGEEGYKSQYTIDYPQGITEEVYTRKDADGNVNEVTVRRIVVKGEYGNEYKKVVTKSGTYYFKNNRVITNQTWDMDTN